ncbi:MAG: hypothetical protein KDC10_03765 [Calditrichaeota bacterium]|nr:hypothetical protein [Calditrichota bacterium]MCB9472801.1 hypothetical protein [Candidatus Delongbacteria bacterium]
MDLVVSDAHNMLKAAITRGFLRGQHGFCLAKMPVSLHSELAGNDSCPTPVLQTAQRSARESVCLESDEKMDFERSLMQNAEWIVKSKPQLAEWIEDTAPEILAHM